MKFRRLCVLVCGAGMLLACGQKGPLVLPDAHQPRRIAPHPPQGGAGTGPTPADRDTATSPGPTAAPSASQSAPTAP